MTNPLHGKWFCNRNYPWIEFMLLRDKSLRRCNRCGAKEECAKRERLCAPGDTDGIERFITHHHKCEESVPK